MARPFFLTIEEYREYGGIFPEDGDEDVLRRYIYDASLIVYNACDKRILMHNQLTETPLMTFVSTIMDALKLATFYQTEALYRFYAYATAGNIEVSPSEISSRHIEHKIEDTTVVEKVSYSNSSSTTTTTGGVNSDGGTSYNAITGIALTVLTNAGLCYRGI